MVYVFYMVDYMISTGSARDAAATEDIALPKFCAGMNEFDTGIIVLYDLCYMVGMLTTGGT